MFHIKKLVGVGKRLYFCAMIDELEQTTKGAYVASIGFFDGVHAGHRFLIDQVKQLAAERGMQSMLITFYEHPRSVLHSDYVPQLLTSPDEKLALLHETSIDKIEVLHFTEEMSKLSAKEYMQQVLHHQFGVNVLVMGYDHRFGHEGGTPEQYRQWGQEVGIEVFRALEKKDNQTATNIQSLSSSAIRRLLTEGNVEAATSLLGHPYTLLGKVVKGHHVGHELGFPTANLEPHVHKLVPARGVYAVWVELENGQRLPGMLNIGERPTIDASTDTTIEVNILDFDGDLYDHNVTLHFISRLREERRFDSREALIRQIEQDEETARNILNINYH